MTSSCRSQIAIALILLGAALLVFVSIGTGREAACTGKKEIEFKLGGDEVLKLVGIEPGKFTMGAPKSELDDIIAKHGQRWSISLIAEEAHQVELTKPFYMGKFEVTRGQFRNFVKEEDYLCEGELADLHWYRTERTPITWKTPGYDQDDHHPVVCVTWNDAMAFCRWLSRKTGKTFDLPTEAEWEFACRAGTQTRYHSGADAASLKGYGNFFDSTAASHLRSKGKKLAHTDAADWPDGYVWTAPVGSFRPNSFELYDMHGNVAEWCKDRFQTDLAIDAPRKDPQSPTKGGHRIVRGGGFRARMINCRSAARAYLAAGSQRMDLGFRVVMRPS